MLNFESDYNQGAHPEILKRLAETNMEHTSGYGLDEYCRSAAEKIKKACECENAAVYFLMGGTQTNSAVISFCLSPWQGVISADTGHIGGHEAGAIEHSGHKVLSIPGERGKLLPERLRAYLETYYGDKNHEHMVAPGMVYISLPTEYGTLYSGAELSALHEICKGYGMPLYVDGARLGYALASPLCDITLPRLVELCDIFYIGGTKVGALFGEALVFNDAKKGEHFFTVMKQQGALLAKGRLLGIQFDTLFTDDLYMRISDNAIDKAEKLRDMLLSKGYTLTMEQETNQLFVTLRDDRLAEISKHASFSFWEKPDSAHTVVRIATSWGTTDEELAELDKYL